MKRFLRFLAGLLLGIGVVLGLLVLLIYLSRERLITWFITELGRTFSAKIYIRAVEVGSLRALPDLGLRLRDFLLCSKQGDSLFSAAVVDLHLNLWEALVKENYRIRALELESPRFWLLYNKEGYTSWKGIFQSSGDSSSEASPWALEKLQVREGQFIYVDQQADFRLTLAIRHLSTSMEGIGDRLQIVGASDGIIEKLFHGRKHWLERQPFALQGTIRYEADWLLASPLRLRLLGVSADLEGGVKLSGFRPEVSLRITDMDLDLSKIRVWWPEAPSTLAQLSGALKGEGDIIGPAGKGKLPRIRLRAHLDIREPFTVESYTCHAFYAQGRLRWYPDLPTKSMVEIDTLFFAGGESDTIYLRGSYSFQSDRLAAAFYVHANLAYLRVWRIPYTEGISGWLHARGQISHAGKKWLLSGEGTLSHAAFPEGAIDTVAFRLFPERMEITDLRGRYGDLRAYIPNLSVDSYTRLWDSTSPPLRLRGKVHLLTFTYTESDTGSGRAALPWTGELEILIDTFYHARARYGPIRARIRRGGDTLWVREAEIQGVGGGKIVYSGLYSPLRIEGEGSFQRIDLARLYEQMPALDTIFPLLKHMRGHAGGRVRAYLPLLRGAPLWTEAEGELNLTLQNLVIIESPYTYELFSLIPLTDFKRIEVGHVETHLTLKEGVLRTDTTWLQANRWKMRVAGAHTLRGELSYDLLVEVPRIVLDKSTRRVEAFVQETEGERVKLAVTVSGTTEKPRFTWKPAGRSAAPDAVSPAPPRGRDKKRKRPLLPVDEQ